MAADPGISAFLRRFAVVMMAVVIAALAVQLAHLMLMVFGGILFAVALRAGAHHLHRWTGLPPRWGALATLAAVICAAVLLGWLVGARVTEQFGQLADRIPQAVDQVRGWLQAQPWGNAMLREGRGLVGSGGGELLTRVSGLASSALGLLTDVLLIVVVMVFIAVDPRLYRQGMIRLFPMATRQRASEVASAATAALRGWLWGQAIAMAITGVLTTLGLLLVGAPLPMALGLVAAVLDFIPFLGPILAAAPALLLAFTEGPRLMLWVALVYVVVQQVEGNLVQPLVQKQAVDLPPALTVVAAVGMGILFGIPGMIFATPLLVVLMVVVRMVYVEDMLGDDATP